MKTASAKAKGRSTQKFVASELGRIFELEEGDVESRPMGSGGVDIMLSPAAKRKFPFSVECKHTRKHPGHAEYKQAKANAKKDTTPAVVWQPHGKGTDCTMITMNFQEFLALWKEKTNDKE